MSTVTKLELSRQAKRLMELFPTSARCHGTYNPDPKTFDRNGLKIKPKYREVHEPLTLARWEGHIAGTYPIVAALACDDGTTKVSAIDVDIYDIDLIEISQRIDDAGLPLYVCRTKSGGAHVYAFHQEPVSIAMSEKVSRGIARALGLADETKGIEIFPRIQKAKPDGTLPLPLELNMPFRGDALHFMKRTGAEMGLDEFLSRVEYLSPEQRDALLKEKEQREATPTSDESGRAFASAKLRRYGNELRNAVSNGNNLLTKHSYHMGMMIGRGWIERKLVEDEFKAAIDHWTNKSNHLQTLDRSLSDGKNNPHPDLADEEAITEDGVALEFAERHADDLRYDCDVGKWYQWTGSHWRRTNKPVAFTYARDLARELSAGHKQKVINVTSKASFAAAVERFAKGDWVLAVEQSAWDPDPYLLGTPEGVVDLHTGELREARPEDYITKITAVGPAAAADGPLWFKFLDEATKGNKELIGFLQVLFGYALVGNTIEQLFIFIHGDGGNGKGVFLNTIGDLLADYSIEAAPEMFTETKYDRHPTELAELRGARLVTSTETAKGRAWNETRIKSLTGSDKVKGRFMRQDFFEFTPQFTPAILGNEKPKLRDVSEAMRRRLVLVPFTHKPKIKDTKLRKKLEPEWPGILRWLIDGCLIWQKEGIKLPAIVQADTDEYFEDQDVFKQFMQFQFVRTKAETAKLSDTHMFSLWGHYAEQVGEETGDKRWFNGKLRGDPYNLKEKPSNGVNYFLGIKLRMVDMKTTDQDQAEMDIDDPTGGGKI